MRSSSDFWKSLSSPFDLGEGIQNAALELFVHGRFLVLRIVAGDADEGEQGFEMRLRVGLRECFFHPGFWVLMFDGDAGGGAEEAIIVSK